MTTYVIDQAHTVVGFTVRHGGISKVRGSMKEFEGTIEVPNADSWDGSSVNVTIQAASVDTGQQKRDDHLRSADFFDVEKFPTWTFKSTEVSGGKEDFKVVGDLTIHGVTKSVTLDTAYLGSAKMPTGGESIGFEASTTILRKDFGLTWNAMMEAGGLLVSDKVTINLDVQAMKQ